jgi:endonuclease YncB( thermonuclease family)
MISSLPVLLLIMLAATPAAASDACKAGVVTGRVSYVRDGDTIELGSMAIRLQGLAAPEWDEPGGQEARQAMIELAHDRQVRCVLDGSRTYDRCAGVCFLEGRDIAESMVSAGLARDCPHYSGGRYGPAELHAAVVGATIRRTYDR